MTKLSRTVFTAVSVLLLALTAPAAAFAYTVTSTADSGAGSLRFGVDSTSDDTIDFDASNNGSPYDVSSGQLNISRNLTINGNGVNQTVIDANHNNRIFSVASDVVFNLSNVTLQNGTVEGSGAAIDNDGTTNVSNSKLTGNLALGDGGGINNSGTLTVDKTTITNNQAYGEGGGISSSNSGDVTITDSTIDHNTAFECGGGIYFGEVSLPNGTLSVTNSTISTNTSQTCGGGVALGAFDSAQFTNATIAYNKVESLNLQDEVIPQGFPGLGGNDGGGGVSAAPNGLQLFFYCLFSSGGFGGGFNTGSFLDCLQNFHASAKFVNTIVALNTVNGSPEDCDINVTSQGDNLDSDATCFDDGNGNLHADPLLGPLQDNGGPTFTHALLAGSPAIDADACPPPFFDQRGVPRPQFNRCDIGAYEFGPFGGGNPIGSAAAAAAAGSSLGFFDSDGDGLPDSGTAAGTMALASLLIGSAYYVRRLHARR